MTTETIDRAEVFSRPAAQFNEDGELVVRASSALGCRRALWYSATRVRANQPAQRRLADGDGGGQRSGAGGDEGDETGWLEGECRRPPGPGGSDHEAQPQAAGDGTP